MSTRAGTSTNGRGLPPWRKYLPLLVQAHVEAGSTLEVRLHPDDDRVVLGMEGTNRAEIRLFLDAPDLQRLHEVIGTAISDLAAQRADLNTTTATTTAVGV